MKKILFFGILLAGFSTQAQVFMTRRGETRFFSKTPLEDIAAVNNKVGTALNTTTGDLAVTMLITQFEFPNKLMQEHFNENYLESEKFPKAFFLGKIGQLPDLTKPGSYPVSAAGTLEMHGVRKARTLAGTLTVTPTALTLNCTFLVPLADHHIEVPQLVTMKIAEQIEVRNTFVLEKK